MEPNRCTAVSTGRHVAFGCCLLTSLWVAAPLVSAAEVYRWVDEHGRVQFSDRPRQGGEQPIHVDSATPQTDDDMEQRRQKRERLLRIFAEDRERERAAQQERDRRQAERDQQCRVVRNELADLERGGVFYELGSNGERHYLSEQDVAQRKARWRAKVQQLCGQ